MENPELELAYNYAQYTHRNIFLTGKAGTGKTTFLKNLQAHTRKRMIVVAPTGVAAINAGGVTIHSFFQLAPGLYLPGQQIQKDAKSRYGFSKHKINILRSLDLLVIDEISMVRCDLLDAIDEVLRRYQNRHLPFGGVQLLMIGDLQQLAPVATDKEWELLKQHYANPYFFSSLALRLTNYTTIELKTVYRQADQTFIDILNKVRENQLDAPTLQALNSRYIPRFNPKDEEGYITLTTHNYQAQDINQMRLTMLPTSSLHFVAKVKGEFPELSYPTDDDLELKVGAQVMFCKNDSSADKLYYNGKIGRVVEMTETSVTVECRDENGILKSITVGEQEWQNTRYKTKERTGEIVEEVIGTFSQIPLKTAWAITIHKSQGLTFDRCIINAGRAFSFGQVYVALSRCRTLQGLVLTTPITQGVVMSDPEIIQYNRFMAGNQPTSEQFATDRLHCIADTLCSLYNFNPIMTKLRYVHRLADEHLPQKLRPFVASLKIMIEQCEAELEQVGRTFIQQIQQMIVLTPTFEENTQLHERLKKANSYFLGKGTQLLDDFFETGLPEIDNQRDKEQLEREFGEVKEDYMVKIQLIISTCGGFSLESYWNTKAKATMQLEADNQPGFAGKKRRIKDDSKPAKPRKPRNRKKTGTSGDE